MLHEDPIDDGPEEAKRIHKVPSILSSDGMYIVRYRTVEINDRAQIVEVDVMVILDRKLGLAAYGSDGRSAWTDLEDNPVANVSTETEWLEAMLTTGDEPELPPETFSFKPSVFVAEEVGSDLMVALRPELERLIEAQKAFEAAKKSFTDKASAVDVPSKDIF